MRTSTIPAILLCLAWHVLLTCSPVRASVSLPGLVGNSFVANTIQEIYSVESGIPVTQANMVLQTRDGYLWVASYDGLVRYDGRRAKVFNKAENDFPSHSIMALYEDSRSRLWIGTNNAGLALYNSQSGFTVFDTGQGLPSNSVRAIAEDAVGTIYVATTSGLAAVSPDLTVSRIALPEFDPVIINSMFVSQKDELWCVLNGGGVIVLALGETRRVFRYYPPGHFNGTVTKSVFQASDGAIYLGFADNTVAILGAGGAFRIHKTGPRQYINSFYEDRQGRVWVCSDTGMGFFRNGIFFAVEGVLLENSIKNMIEDFEGNLWFASARKGLLQVIRSKFFNISEKALLPPLVVNAVLKHREHLYIGHDQGLTILDGNYITVDNALTHMLTGTRIRNIIKDDENSLWFSTYSAYGIARYSENGDVAVFNQAESGLASDTVRCAIAGKDGRIIVGTANGISVIRNNAVVRNYTRKDGLHNPVIMNLFEDEDGTLYAGSDGGGMYVISPEGGVRAYTEADGLPSGIIMRLRHDPVLKGLWISTENGLCFWDGKGIRRIDKLGDYGVNIFDIQLPEDDAVWLLGSTGISIVNRSNLLSDDPLEVHALKARDGLRNTITANAWNFLTLDNTLYLCTNGGILSIETDAVYQNNIPPKLIISRVLADGKAFEHPERVVLPSDANRVTIDFSLISYTHPTGNSVKFYMEGSDKEPTTVSADMVASISYTNLPGGRHRFIIVGRNKEGATSPEFVLPVIKQPGLMEQPAVWGGIFCAVFLLLFLASKTYVTVKTQRLLKRQQEYREITDQAIRAVADTVDAKDPYTSGHSKRVAEYSLRIAARLGLPEKEREDLYYAALLHDIGKVGLADNILNKPGKLTDEEYDTMKQHVVVGGDILRRITVIKDIATGARYHHERFDGQGYCANLSGESIPLFARIICVADAYDAMHSNRAYRESQSLEYIIGELERGKGTQFDREIATIMIDLIQSGKLSSIAA